jgi:hypothetical protein
VPRSPLQAWRAYQENLDECPTVVAFFPSPPGLACLHRRVLALHGVWVEVGACGMRLVCLLLKITGLNRFVGASSGAQQQVNRHVEEAIVLDRQQEGARLAHAMPTKDITLTQDATFTGGLSLGGGPREPLHCRGASGLSTRSRYLACLHGAGPCGSQLLGHSGDKR